MRYKVIPPAAGPDALFAVRDALPLVPGSVEDCCTRIRDRTAVPSRDRAREWLAFCQALGLAAETERGYHRVREDRGVDELGERLLVNVFPARELRDALADADGPLDADEAFEHLRDHVPRWERNRSADWRERVERLLRWGVHFDVFRESGDGYELP